jgi:hypothetical protein
MRQPGPWRRGAVLALGLAAIVLWQAQFAQNPRALDSTFRQSQSQGLFWAGDFVYFFYYLGLFPVAVAGPGYASVFAPGFQTPSEYSVEGARRFLIEHRKDLVMDRLWTFEAGEYGRILLYVPDALLKGAPRSPSVRPCHAIVFILSLGLVFLSCWAIRRPVLGAVLVLFFGSDPFQLFEVYAHEGVFGWPISTALLVLALHLPMLGDEPCARHSFWLVPLVTACLLATVWTVRSEPLPIILSAAATYLCVAGGVGWGRRVGAVLVLLATFWATSTAWDAYYRAKFDQARDVVAALGGHPMPRMRRVHHGLWHPVWTGFGDFDTKYGHAWFDQTAYRFALPVLEQKYGETSRLNRYDMLNSFWDDDKMYRKLPEDLPHYADVLRADIKGKILSDPAWYLGILSRRAWRVLSETTPVQLAVGGWRLRLPFHGLVFLPLIGLLLVARSWTRLKLALFMLPLSLTALAIYSGGGTCFYSCYHLVAAAILVTDAPAGLLLLRGSLARGGRGGAGAPSA